MVELMRVLTGAPESSGLTAIELDDCRDCRRIRRRLRKLPGWLLCDFHAGHVTGYERGYNDALTRTNPDAS